MKPGGQEQEKELTRLLQEPPFVHGKDKHSLMSVQVLAPADDWNPGEQLLQALARGAEKVPAPHREHTDDPANE